MPKPRDVDAYIAAAPGEIRPKLEEVRTVIRAAVPKAEEGISWGVPFYKYHGPLAGFAAYKHHVSFGLGGADLGTDDRKMLEDRGYRTGKKTFRITLDQKVPGPAIRKLLKAQAKVNAERQSSARQRSRSA
jgi:uncharacterized protein YdhG (YjbR/CyaY superfamily)